MVAQVHSIASSDYYLGHEAGIYYVNGELSPGVWYGEGAEAFGYRGPIEPSEFLAAYDGKSSDGLASLVQEQAAKSRQPGWDITFSAPKSVSVLWMMLSDDQRRQLQSLLMHASRSAVDYLDSNCLVTRRGKGGARIENGRGIYALCPHATSRAQDPQLHVHALCFNMCLRDDGTTGAIRSHDLYLHKMAAGAVFRAELAHLLRTEMGLAIRQVDWSFEVEGVPKALCQEFSKRRQQIEEIADREGWTSAAVLSKLAIETRTSKQDVPLHDLMPVWHKVAEAYGWSHAHAMKLVGGTRQKAAENFEEHRRAKIDQIKQAIGTLSASEAYFSERELVRAAAEGGLALGLSAKEIIDVTKWAVGHFQHRVDRADSDYWLYSTKENVASEKELLSRAISGARLKRHLVSEGHVDRAQRRVENSLSDRLGARTTLTGEQAKALRHVTLEPGDLKLVQGVAGSGKTQLLEAANLAWKASGYNVIGAALSGKAAMGLEDATGIRSYTVEQLLRSLNPQLSKKERVTLFATRVWGAIKQNWKREKYKQPWTTNPWKQLFQGVVSAPKEKFLKPKLNRKSILVVDEAAMLSTTGLLALQREASKAGAKIVAIGDKLQLPPIEAGCPFVHLCQQLGHANLTDMIRQEHQWMRDALSNVIHDEPEAALEAFAENDSLVIAPHRKAAIGELVGDWFWNRTKDLKNTLVLTSTNAEATDINRRIQRGRQLRHELGRLSLRLPGGGRVFKHDRVVFTKNDYRKGVRNGLIGTVERIHFPRGVVGPGTLVVRLDRQQPGGLIVKRSQRVEIDLKKYKDIQLGYALTTHKAQGVTVEKSFVLFGEDMLNREMAFTQLSRARQEARIYAAETKAGEGMGDLAKLMSRSRRKDLAHDHRIEEQQRWRRHAEDQRQRQDPITQTV